MARRRVFRTRVQCPGLRENIKTLIAPGLIVTFQKSPVGTVYVTLEGKPPVGHLDEAIAVQVATAIDRGQSFVVTVEDAWGLAREVQWLRLKVEYFLDKGQPAILVPETQPDKIHQQQPAQ